jgi:MFS family permease
MIIRVKEKKIINKSINGIDNKNRFTQLFLKNELTNFYLFLVGQFVSQFGSKLTSYGLVLWAYKQSSSVLSTSLLTISYLIPEVMLSFIAGSICDSWNKKKIMLIADGIAAFFSALVILLLLTDSLQLHYLYVINFMLGVTDAFQNPAAEVVVTTLVSRENYMKTSGLRSFSYSFMGIFAPIVATSLYAFYGLKLILFLDLTSFCFAFLSLAFFVHIPKLPQVNEKCETVLSKCKVGICYIIERKDLFQLILFMAFVNFVAAIYNTNLSPMILSRSGNSDVQLGIVSSAVGIAGLFGSFIVTKSRITNNRVNMMLNIMTFSFVICNGLLGLGRNYYIWTIAVFLGNVFIPLLTANVEFIMRTKIPAQMQGRVFSARNTLQYTSLPLGNLIGGFVADKVFEPYMRSNAVGHRLFTSLVGSGNGSGIAVLYLCIAVIGFAGCCMFRMNKQFRKLNEE